MRAPDQKHLESVERCLNEGRFLTKWEVGFLESLQEKLERGLFLSDTEAEKLQEIEEARVR
jgi:hypothetical protein